MHVIAPMVNPCMILASTSTHMLGIMISKLKTIAMQLMNAKQFRLGYRSTR